MVKLQHAAEPPGGLVQTQMAGLHTQPRGPESIDLMRGLRICIFNKLTGDAATSLKTNRIIAL